MSDKFASKFNVEQSMLSRKERHNGTISRMNAESLSKAVGLDKATVSAGVATLFEQAGTMWSQGHRLVLDFGVGTVVGEDRAILFSFAQGSNLGSTGSGHAPSMPKATSGSHSMQQGRSPRRRTQLSEIPNVSKNLQMGKVSPRPPPKDIKPSKGSYRNRTKPQNKKVRDDVYDMSAFKEEGHVQIAAPSNQYSGNVLEIPTNALSHSAGVPEDDFFYEEGGNLSGRWKGIRDSALFQHEYPPLLDLHSRTRGAVWNDNRGKNLKPDKIGTHYSPNSTHLAIDAQTGIKASFGTEAAVNPFTGKPVLSQSQVLKQEKANTWRTGKSQTFDPEDLLGKVSLQDTGAHPLPLREQVGIEMGGTLNDAALLSEGEQQLLRDRYKYYVDYGVKREDLASMKGIWVSKAMSLMPAPPKSLTHSEISAILSDSVNELRVEYVTSMSKATVDYVLRSPSERVRLSIPTIPDGCQGYGWGWGEGKNAKETPVSWKNDVSNAAVEISRNLLICDKQMVAVLGLWQDYSDLSLTNVPPTDDDAQAQQWQPLAVSDFLASQIAHIDNVKQTLTNKWHPAALSVYERAMAAPGRFNIPVSLHQRYFSTLATLMSNQIRDIVTRSVEQFVSFWERFDFQARGIRGRLQSDLCVKSYSHSETEIYRPAFVENLVINGSLISLRNSFGDIKEAALKVFDHMVTALSEITRLEHKNDLAVVLDTPRYLSGVKIGEAFIQNAREKVTRILKMNYDEVFPFFEIYSPFVFLLNEENRVQEFVTETHSVAEFGTEVQRYQKAGKEVSTKQLKRKAIHLFLLNCDDLNHQLSKKANDLANGLLQTVAQDNVQRNLAVVKRFKQIDVKLKKKPGNSTELVVAEAYFEDVKATELKVLDQDIREIKERLDFLFTQGYRVTDELLQPTGNTFRWVKTIGPVLEEAQTVLSQERDKLENKFRRQREKFQHELEELDELVNKLGEKGDIKAIWDYVEQIETIKRSIQIHDKSIDEMNEEETQLGIGQTEFTQLAEIKKALDPYDKLWNTASEFQKSTNAWLRGPILNLDPEEVEASVQTMYRTMYKLSKQLEETAPKPALVATNIKEQLDKFRGNVPIVHIICNKGLRDRHWAEMSSVVRFHLKPDEHTNLQRLLDLDINIRLEELEAISESATKEYSIEKTLDTMAEAWEPLHFDLPPYKDTGTYILSGGPIDEITTVLDDHIVKAQTMRGSAFAKPFQQRIQEWEQVLSKLQDILDSWVKVQSTWLYLEPIFSSDDIVKQMPLESKQFGIVDSYWRSIMAAVKADPQCIRVTNIPDLLEKLQESNGLLEEIQKGLNAYLETKRLFFARFFFLSNDELLEILSETKDPLRVQPHLKKCFEGISLLEFAENLDIKAMISAGKESVPMSETINPNSAKGAVEVWLSEVERVMRVTVHATTRDAITDYPAQERSKWVLKWPGQLVVNVSQMFWTVEVEEAFSKGGSDGLKAYLGQLNQQLDDIVTLVRGKLSKLNRTTLGALTVMDVHARDTIQKISEAGTDSVKDFDWQSQLRYYWEQDEFIVRMINSELQYGNEYIGNSGRLVITPLTDRCYRTLMGAVHLQYGGAPEGPAGTGKTETVKDLSKAMARQCIVFNCSDGLDYLAMAKFFKGLASSGAWACFDEFNRIKLEVLSVIAQQVSQIQAAIAKNLDSFHFEGTELKIVKTANSFITMNPGYAGRAELPDNLKVLYRTVAMMVPDYAMIAEIILFSYGYGTSRSLSVKIVQCYKLCSEQLSSQDHYDYGMRAVMAVLKAAGNLRQKCPELSEDMLILRAIKDVNLAKFLSHDIPLFQGITSDLFPGVELPEPDYKDLHGAINESILEQNLQPVPAFVEKIIQLYEMVVVRHGLMVVGEPLSGKTRCMRVLASTLNKLNEAKKMPCSFGDHELPVDTMTINPKSITMGQLYGCFDDISHEWSDGILPITFRTAANATDDRRKWLVFDGPVDAIWIENMNTVLDDNKKLCLMTGEIIQMSAEMNMIFEPMDLAVASPATVSRCGMVYMEPHRLGFEPLLESWLVTLPERVSKTEEVVVHIRKTFEWVLPALYFFSRRNLKELVPTSEMMRSNNLLQIFTLVLDLSSHGNLEDMPNKDLCAILDGVFLFSLAWSAGATTDGEGRNKFDHYLKRLWKGDDSDNPRPKSLKSAANPPDRGTIFDYKFTCDDKGSWKLWTDTIDKDFVIAPGSKFNSISVPTVDTTRYTFLLDAAVSGGKQVLFVGPTGTGKTVNMKNYILGLDADKFALIQTQFSAQTSANQTQDVIDGKLDKRRKGVYGPPMGKRCIIFVDDLNMPQVEVYGAQPPIELLRQFMDHGGWYDQKEKTLKSLVDITILSAMGSPGGGRNHITPRIMRHFLVVAMTEVQEETLSFIYSTILDWHLSTAGFDSSIKSTVENVIEATRVVYQASIDSLLPTPTKSHYTFNLRDFGSVIQGMMLIKKDKIGDDTDKWTRLWVHEINRVFQDRLTNIDDKNWLHEQERSIVKKLFGSDFNQLFSHFLSDGSNEIGGSGDMRKLFFGDYMVPGADPKLYDEIRDQDLLHKNMEDYLEEYNAISKKPMELVLFQFAIEHTSRIARIFKLPGGNALLVGVGGSGRQSLTRLATYVSEYDLFQIEISKTYGVAEWHDDIKSVLMKAGGDGKQTVFLLSDNQMKYESFVEDINNLLNTGEIPNLFAPDEKQNAVELVRTAAKADRLKIDTSDGLYNYFLTRVKENLHIVLCFSPIGSSFRERVRQFPSLVNACTIDWFSAWPSDALESVARKYLGDIEVDPQYLEASVEMCKIFHSSTFEYSTQFLAEMSRNTYVTPTLYLELLSTFKTLLSEKRAELTSMRSRYTIGLEKLDTTTKSVDEMSKQLVALQPQLVQTTKETEAMMLHVEEEQLGASKIEKVVKAEEAVAAGKAAKAKAIKDECEGDLEKAMPILESALAALNTLNKNDITEVKGMKSPPNGVRLTMEGMCHVFQIKAAKVKNPDDPTKTHLDFWEPAKKNLLSDMNFLQKLKDYDKDNIAASTINKLRPLLENPEFTPDNVKKSSKAAHGLCLWLNAIVAYDKVTKVVAPKRIKLAESEAEYDEVMKGLTVKQNELKAVEDKVAALATQLKACETKKERLENEVQECTNKLDRAEKLIAGLGGEKVRWKEESEKLNGRIDLIFGDVLFSSGTIAYLGPFTATYRRNICADWAKLGKERGLVFSDKSGLPEILGEPVKIRAWNIAGLPTDTFSTENGIILNASRRWPLMIDPQGQANKWIRNLEADNKLQLCSLKDPNYLRTLEISIQFGHPVLLENVGEELDPALEPILAKQIFRKGGVKCIKLGENVVEYSDDFRFYITTKLRNPHYLPEVSVKVTLINFMITPVGLADQMLGTTVAKERPAQEEQKNALVMQGAENKRQLKEIEDKILHVLSSSKGNILDDSTAIEVLTRSKVVANDIAEKQAIAEETEKQIDEARQQYVPVATRAQLLFFCISDLAHIEPMYQYSLTWFVNLFLGSIDKSEPSSVIEDRVESLNDHFTYSLYLNVCRSLFEKDKLLFSFSLIVKILMNEESALCKAIVPSEYAFLLTGGTSTQSPPELTLSWMSEKAWGEMFLLEKVGEDFAGIFTHLTSNASEWKGMFDAIEPEKFALPGKYNANLSAFQRLLVLRCMRPDKLIPGIQIFVENMFGHKFIDPPQFDLAGPFAESTPVTPLIFVLSPASDPLSTIVQFAESKSVEYQTLSLGQGQGTLAERIINNATTEGKWVILQNCHVYPSWMPALERLCENFDATTINSKFRLWLTSYPSEDFPVSLLQNGIKLTKEPPKGLRANLLGAYRTDPISSPEFYASCIQEGPLKKLMFGLCFFHAVVQERRTFGPLGWNIPYGFDESDLRISVRQVHMFLNEAENGIVPFKTLKYLIGECNYGGRVTDDRDRRCIRSILNTYLTETVLDDAYKFSESGKYFAPEEGSLDKYVEYLKTLPINAAPEVFGMNANADISKDQKETFSLLSSLLTTMPKVGTGGGVSPEEAVVGLVEDIVKQLPEAFDMEIISLKFPVLYEESMNTVLRQELIRFNRLTAVIRQSAIDLKKALKGLIVMNDVLEKVFNAFLIGAVPALWMKSSYPSLKPLGGYVENLLKRLDFFQKWVDDGTPLLFWLSGFYFQQGFLTGSLQNFARSNAVSIDSVGFDFQCLTENDPLSALRPTDGVLTYGLYIEGARWDYEKMVLGESNPKELFVPGPNIWLRPKRAHDIGAYPHYDTPVYKTSERRGVLATTGHSTNFVMSIRLPSDKPESHWVKRGVAFLTQLDY
jgi:dynein heavy chain